MVEIDMIMVAGLACGTSGGGFMITRRWFVRTSKAILPTKSGARTDDVRSALAPNAYPTQRPSRLATGSSRMSASAEWKLGLGKGVELGDARAACGWRRCMMGQADMAERRGTGHTGRTETGGGVEEFG